MADKTISDLEQVAEVIGNLKLACEGDTGNTSSLTLTQLLEFLHAPVQSLTVSGTRPNYVLNPANLNVIYTADLSGLNSTDNVQINLPSGSEIRERQIIIKIKNPNLATIQIPGLRYKLSQLDLLARNVQLILDYDQSLSAWTAGTLAIEGI